MRSIFVSHRTSRRATRIATHGLKGTLERNLGPKFWQSRWSGKIAQNEPHDFKNGRKETIAAQLDQPESAGRPLSDPPVS